VKAIKLMIELAETKPWFVAYDFRISRREQQAGERPLNFETLEVTTNLELALRYLRRENHARTLWIDALCINQKDKAEKTIQIQRMQWIYANASPVVVWLGGYHGLGGTDVCAGSSSQKGVDCEHQREIQAAFDYIWARSGWRLLFRWYFSHNEKERFQESRSGLCELARRGWWERLWVIQEVALATGRVQMQCGNNTCDFEEFVSAEDAILLEHTGEKALTDGFRSSENFRDTIQDFCYSSFHDREGLLTRALFSVLMRTMGMFFRDIGSNVPNFHELPFAHRLHCILLRTAGRFKCHDDRDRLRAVLGIAEGATTGKVTQTASLMETISSLSTQQIIWNILNPMWTHRGRPVKGAWIVFNVIWALWGAFYDRRAKHWTFNRPYYVVAEHAEVIEAVTTGPEEEPSRVEFFTAIARYLAKETESLAFLDVATCGEDEDEGMPSWVPNWRREISKPAYDFANRIKKDQPPDLFKFLNSDKTLQLDGLPKGRVNIMQPADLDLLQSSPWQGAFEKVLVLPSEAKRMVAKALKLIGIIMHQRSSPISMEEKKRLISYLVNSITDILDVGLSLLRKKLLRADGTTMVYSYDMTAGVMELLRAGEAVKGDQLVFVPGCFHHLVLRSREHTTKTSIRWKLVGLMAMSTTITQGRRGYSKSEWAQLLDDGAVCKYNIE
jgi:hypothetical protein